MQPLVIFLLLLPIRSAKLDAPTVSCLFLRVIFCTFGSVRCGYDEDMLHAKSSFFVSTRGFCTFVGVFTCCLPLLFTSVVYLCCLPLLFTSVDYLCRLPLSFTSVVLVCAESLFFVSARGFSTFVMVLIAVIVWRRNVRLVCSFVVSSRVLLHFWERALRI